MRTGLLLLFLGVAVALVGAHPVEVSSQNEAKAPASTGTLHRERRTIGILRDLFPNFSKMIDQKIQQLTRIIFRIVGRLVLNGGGGGAGGGGGGGGGGDSDDDRRISITLPTYPPDLVDEDEDEDSTDNNTEGGDATTTLSPDGENAVAESKIKEVRVKREAEQPKAAEEEEASEDLETDATGDNEVSDDSDAESSEFEEEEEEEDPRNKRFLNFNLGASAGGEAGASAGSGGGSGNFLFDIIRLVAGSGSSPGGEGTHAATEEGKGDEAAYGVGVPGPLTRLFVVANKGVASLIQDLILRLAQTSERIVNFKARLITSII